MIDVIVPCLNAEKYLNRCIDSLLNQTVKVNIIIVDDGSIDDTREIAEKYAAEHENISLVRKRNEGLPQARKTGFEAAKSEYIGFIDADDWAEPGMYEALLKNITESGSDVASCGCNFLYENGKKEYLNVCGKAVIDNIEALRMINIRKAVFAYMWNKLFKREIIKSEDFPTGNFVGEDYATVIHIFSRVKKVAIVEDALYDYRQNVQSMSHDDENKDFMLSVCNFKNSAEYLCKKYPTLERSVNCYLMVEYMAIIVAMFRNKRRDEKLLNEINAFNRKHLSDMVFMKGESLIYKGAALLAAIDCRLLNIAYKLIYR